MRVWLGVHVLVRPVVTVLVGDCVCERVRVGVAVPVDVLDCEADWEGLEVVDAELDSEGVCVGVGAQDRLRPVS